MNMNLTAENIVEGITLVDSKDIPNDVQRVIGDIITNDDAQTLTAAYYIGNKEESGGTDYYLSMKQTTEEDGKKVYRFVFAEIFVSTQTVTNEDGEEVTKPVGTLRRVNTAYDFSTNPELKNSFNQVTAQERRTKYTALWLYGINGDDFYVLTNTQSTRRGMKPVLSVLKINKANGNLTTSDIIGF